MLIDKRHSCKDVQVFVTVAGEAPNRASLERFNLDSPQPFERRWISECIQQKKFLPRWQVRLKIQAQVQFGSSLGGRECVSTWDSTLPFNELLAPSERNVRFMNQKAIIRDETNADIDAITEVTIAAFKTLEISNHTEQFIIEALRAARALAISLVAELDGRVIGHIAFSPVTISDGTENWYGLGPVSVLPEFQRKGIGGTLIQEGLARLKDLKAGGCCLVGHPDYYKRFGFTNTPGLTIEGVPPEVFFALSFGANTPVGKVTFHEGFGADGR